ncbi:lasso peptide isopeptide bond-forming cyclase [Novosphingobium sp. 11B]
MNTTFSILADLTAAPDQDGSPGHTLSRRLVHSSDLKIQLLCHGDVVIIGDVFPAARSPSVAAFEGSGSDPLDFLAAFAGAYWGRYVGLARNPETGELAIYRDPSGMVPCYYGHSERRVSIATDAVSISAQLGIRPTIDWSSIANHLLAPDRRQSRTCLDGITEVLPGELVRVGRDGARRELIWKPADYAGRNLEIRFGDAASLIETTLAQAVAVWSQRYPHPLVAVSGGFDSSSIAALAAQSGPIDLLVYFARSPLADERSYAGQVAKHLGLGLHAEYCDPRHAQVSRNLSAARPRPSARAFTQVFDRHAEMHGEALGTAAHFNGGGGDNVFGKLHSAYPLADRYLHEGLTRHLPRTATDICGATGASLPSVLRQALAAVSGRLPGKAWPGATELLSRRAIDMRDDSLHPWLYTETPLWPAQKQLIRNIARATAGTDHLHIEGALPTIYPLLSQPLVELCLSLPTWFWFEGGRDRAVARAAMKVHLPAGILERKLKGAFDGLVYQIVDLNRAAILEDLKNGVLASQGLIDLEAVGSVMGGNGSNEVHAIRTLHLHEVEMWCRHWC